ncbi:type VI secretion system baseplate subunit TssK, partial [Halocynthiibacter sp.]|uniref:type VI secretion system baseplate subunit TssK n=1 Tax=Halocynthiibacter sp. TaxID=1979210 RepID=UPI003C366D53
MSSSFNKVVWSDGLFVKPHHFQQQTRYHERFAVRLAAGSDPYNYGFTSLILNDEMLAMGKVAIVSSAGIMPDGTPFDMPGQDNLPPVLDISEGFTANQIIYLCLPLSMEGGLEVQPQNTDASVAARFSEDESAIRDNTMQADALVPVKVAKANPVLMLDKEDLSAFTKIAV